MINELNISEKRVIFYILSQIMKADNILNPAEITFLDNVFEKFQLGINEFDHMDELSFDELCKEYRILSPETKNMPICFLYAWQNVTDMWIQGNLR